MFLELCIACIHYPLCLILYINPWLNQIVIIYTMILFMIGRRLLSWSLQLWKVLAVWKRNSIPQQMSTRSLLWSNQREMWLARKCWLWKQTSLWWVLGWMLMIFLVLLIFCILFIVIFHIIYGSEFLISIKIKKIFGFI